VRPPSSPSIASIALIALIALIAALSCAVACASPQPKATSAPTTSATEASVAPLPSSSASEIAGTTPSSSPSATPDPDPDPPKPPISTAGWKTISSTKKTITLEYPPGTFPKTKVGAGSIRLLSNLTRAGLADDANDPQYWRFEIAVELSPGTPFDRVKKKYASYPFPDMFPKGTEASFVSQPGTYERVKVGGWDGYTVWTGVEGYDAAETFLAIDAKTTLDFTCRYVGDVMGPEIPEDEQTAICGAVLASVRS